MKNKNLLNEFKDPYQKNSTNFAPASVSSGPERAPTPAEVQDIFDPKKPLKPAPNVQVVQKLDLDPKNVNCIKDLTDNWMYYAAFGAFVAASTYPIVRPALTAMGKVGAASARGVGSPYKTALAAKEFVDKTLRAGFKQTMAAVGTSLKSFLIKPGRVKALGSWFLGGKSGAGALQNLGGSWNALKGGKPASAMWRASKGTAGGAWASVKMTKNIFLVALVTTIVYKNFGLEKFFKSGSESDNKVLSAGSTYIDIFMNFFIQYDMALEAIMLKMNTNLSKECALTNVIASTVLCTFLLPAGATGGSKLTLSYKLDDVTGLKTADDLKLFVKQERANIIGKLNASALDDFQKIFKEAGMSEKQARQFFDAYLKNPKKATIQGATNAQVQAKCAAAYAKREKELIEMISKQDEGLKVILEGTKKTSDEVRKTITGITENAKAQVRALKTDFRVMSFAQTPLAKIQNLGPLPYGASIDKLLDIRKSLNTVDDLLKTGQISVREASKMYNNLFQRPLSKFSKEVVKAANLDKSSRGRVENLIIVLNNFQKDQKLLKDAFKVAGPPGNPNWLEKIFQTRRARQTDDALNLRVADAGITVTMMQIQRMNSRFSPDDLKRIEQSISDTHTVLRTASGAGVKSTKLLAAERALVVGLISAVTTAIAKEFFMDIDDVNDLETWRKKSLAKSLAWDGFFSWALIDAFRGTPTKMVNALIPGAKIKNPSVEEKYQDALLQLIDKVIDDRQVVASIYLKYIFAGNGNFLKKSFGDIKSFEELNDSAISRIVNDFRVDKSNFQKIEAALQTEFGANFDNLGISGLNSNNNAIEFRKIWWPVLMNILVANSGLIDRIKGIVDDKPDFFQTSEEDKIKFLNSEVFKFKNPDDVNISLEEFKDQFDEELNAKRKGKKLKENQVKEEKQKQKNLISELVQEVIQEYGKGYTPYPYHSHIGEEDEPAEDFVQDWKDFELSLVRDQTRETAISVAKILVKDLELFGDVMDLVGKNQSVAVEILQKLRKDEENS